MEIPCYSQVITDNVTEEVIDAYTLSKQLESLRALAVEYNDRTSTNPLNRIEIVDDKFKLIISLWQRGITIPTHLNITYGAPYDEVFMGYSELTTEDTTILAPIEDTVTYNVLKNPQQLLGFLVAVIDFPNEDMTAEEFATAISRLTKLNFILFTLKVGEIKTLYEFTLKLLRLRQVDLVYIALELENNMVYRKGISIWTYVRIYRDK